jgi:ABC-2 type transport system permease protein
MYAYPVQMLISAPIFLLHVFLFYALYSTTYAVTNAKSISGFSLAQTIWLLVLTYICDSTYGGKWSRIIDEEVRSGTLAYSLNRPFSYVLYHYCAMLGSSLPRFFCNLVIGAAATIWLVGPLSLSLVQICVCLVSIVGGCTLNFLINFCIGLGALWLEDTEGIVWIISKSRRVLGGHMIPLYFLPSTMKMIAESLPFSMISYGPSLLMVSFTSELCYKVFTIQSIWIAIMGTFAFFLFNRGIRNVSINGG